jgi:hypothetical protein
MQEILFVAEEAEDGSFGASAAGAAIHTEADTLEDLHREIRDAVVCHFEIGEAPPLIRFHHVRQELLALSGFRGTSTASSWPSASGGMATN